MTNLELLRMLGEEGLITFRESGAVGEVRKAYINNEEDYGQGIEILFNLDEDVEKYHRIIPQPKNRSILDDWWEVFNNG